MPSMVMWDVLKFHITRDRARKKRKEEAEVEEERLRKEREAREQQDKMTLGETREQISQLETKLQQLKEEKHQLFLQLKKVLNEDDNRRRLVKENRMDNSEHMIGIHHLQQPPNQRCIQTIPHQQQAQPPPQTAFKATNIKRPRSPSPPPQVPVTMYHQGYNYKPQAVSSAAYLGSPQKDDGRRNELVRAVLWNKTPQYTNQPSAFYPVAPQELSMYYPIPREAASRNVYENQRPPPQTFQIDHNKLPEHYTTLRSPASHTHVIHTGSGLAISPAQPPKGSITSGYPVRSQTQQYQQPSPASLYTAQSRPIYQQTPNGPIQYPPRD